jgi:5-methyltetrahydrofolate--homocysteine methyltransferase
MANEVQGKLKHSMLELDKEATLEAVRVLLDGGAEGAKAGVDSLGDALAVVGKRFQDGDWFLNELVYAGEIAKEATELLTPHLAAAASEALGVVVVGSVQGDMHDLGKNIFNTYARSAGFEIVDLGTDVSAERFAEAARKHRPVAVGMSCLLTVCAGGIGRVIEGLGHEGLREGSKVIIGGAALTEEFAREVGADAFAPDAVTGTEIIRAWSEA